MTKIGTTQDKMANLWSLLKNLSLVERMKKVAKNKALQVEINQLRVHPQKRMDWVEELQTEVEQVSQVIEPKNLEIKQELIVTMGWSAEHITFDAIDEVTMLK